MKVQPRVAPCEIGVLRQGFDTYAVRVAFRAVETRAVENCVVVRRFHDLGEVVDRPNGVGTACLGHADVVDVNAAGGCSRVSTHGLEGVPELNVHFHLDVGNFPSVVGIRCVKMSRKCVKILKHFAL